MTHFRIELFSKWLIPEVIHFPRWSISNRPIFAWDLFPKWPIFELPYSWTDTFCEVTNFPKWPIFGSNHYFEVNYLLSHRFTEEIDSELTSFPIWPISKMTFYELIFFLSLSFLKWLFCEVNDFKVTCFRNKLFVFPDWTLSEVTHFRSDPFSKWAFFEGSPFLKWPIFQTKFCLRAIFNHFTKGK